jgi:hypothetical protein
MPRKKRNSDNHTEPADGANAGSGNGSAEQPQAKKKRPPRRKLAQKKVADEKVDAASPQISDEAIRLRAYFIAEERLRRGIPGDEHSDWLEARRQLTAEFG